MWSTRQLLRVDDLSYTHRPVQAVEYVSDLVLYLVMRAAGPLGLQVVGALLTVGTALALLGCQRRASWIAVPVITLAIATTQAWLLVRPATASFCLLAALLSLLLRNVPWSPRRVLGVALLFVLWSNVHGFVVIGLAVLAGRALCALVARIARGQLGGLAPREDGTNAVPLALVLLLSILGAACNQAGFLLLLGPLRAANDFGRITEWQTTSWAFLVDNVPLALPILALALAALALGGDPESESTSRALPSLFDIGLVTMAALLARSAVRMIPIATILVTPTILRRLGARLSRMERAPWTHAFALAPWLLVPWLVISSRTARGVGFDPAHFSEPAIDFVRASRTSGNMYDSLPLGGWLDWKLYPEHRTFVDHRQGWVHDPDLLRRYYASEEDPVVFDALAREYDFTWAVIIAAEGNHFGGPIARSPRWAMVFWDDSTAIYVRANGPNARLARSGYRLMRHLTLPEDILASSIRRDPEAVLLAADAKLAKKQDPTSPRAIFLTGCAAIALADHAGLDAALRELSTVRPGHAGIAALQAGWDQAEQR